MQALSESRVEHVNSILALDENLAQEQQTRMEQERVVAELQAALTERTTKEAATDKRATEAETNLAALKRSYRELRLQVAFVVCVRVAFGVVCVQVVVLRLSSPRATATAARLADCATCRRAGCGDQPETHELQYADRVVHSNGHRRPDRLAGHSHAATHPRGRQIEIRQVEMRRRWTGGWLRRPRLATPQR